MNDVGWALFFGVVIFGGGLSAAYLLHEEPPKSNISITQVPWNFSSFSVKLDGVQLPVFFNNSTQTSFLLNLSGKNKTVLDIEMWPETRGMAFPWSNQITFVCNPSPCTHDFVFIFSHIDLDYSVREI